MWFCVVSRRIMLCSGVSRVPCYVALFRFVSLCLALWRVRLFVFYCIASFHAGDMFCGVVLRWPLCPVAVAVVSP